MIYVFLRTCNRVSLSLLLTHLVGEDGTVSRVYGLVDALVDLGEGARDEQRGGDGEQDELHD